MAVNLDLTRRVRELLTKAAHVDEKRMFGGIAFMVDGKMCVTVSNNRIMCRVDPMLHKELTLRSGVTTVKMKGREYVGWIYVDETTIPDKKTLGYWVNLALDFNDKIS